jgi:predicted TIM-barrel fold metal-dependent hydrolase
MSSEVIDADRHVMEPPDVWLEYVDSRFKSLAPEYRRADGPGAQPLIPHLAGRPIWRPLPPATQECLSRSAFAQRAATREAQTAAGQLADMDRAGISRAFLYPTIAGYLVSIDTLDPELSHALADAYNRWLLDLCADAPQRLFPVALIARHLPDRMALQARGLARRGVRAVMMRPNPVLGRTLSDPSYEEFWSACEELDLAVCIHEGTHALVATTGTDRFETRFGQHACSHPMEQMMAILSFIEGGVLERHPRLRVAFLEAGCGWLPYWLWRLDELEYRHLRGEVSGRVTKEPSRYFREQCWIAFEPSEPLLAHVIDEIGADRVLFGTDFPHVDHGPHTATEAAALSAKLRPDVLRCVTVRNAEAFFRLNR